MDSTTNIRTPEVFYKKVALKSLPTFTGKNLCQSLIFIKVAGLAYNFIKKEALAQGLSSEFSKIFKNTSFLFSLTKACFRKTYTVL